MNWQAIVVGIIIFSALLYTANLVWQKVKSFSPKSECGTDCACESKSERKHLAHAGKE